MVNITWLGHASFKVEHDNFVLLVDPWIGNPKYPENMKEFDKVDVILVTHGHFDHVGETAELAKKHGSKVVCIFEVSQFLLGKGVPENQIIGMNKGGTVDIGSGFSVTMVNAIHSSGLPGDNGIVAGGEAAGFVIHTPDGHHIYHGGDTDVFYDMKLISDLHQPDIAMLPIGGHFTMDPREAAYALDNLLHSVKKVIPMHFGTFPILAGTPDELKASLTRDVEILAMNPGETINV